MICEYSGKKCLSQKEAGNIIRLCHTSYRKRHYAKKVPSRSYFCPYCKSYHITHHKKRDYLKDGYEHAKGEYQYTKRHRK